MCKRLLKSVLSGIIISSMIVSNFVFASTVDEKRTRIVYLHAQGENPTQTIDNSIVYMGDTADVYLAVDNPNKGDYDNGTHNEPQFDMNGYTVKVYFDPAYFDYAAADTSAPIEYNVPDANKDFYYVHRHGSGQNTVNGRTYKTAFLTVFFQGRYLPQKSDSQLWYNLCKLPLKPIKTGSTDVFIEVGGSDQDTLELFAKNQSEILEEQYFVYNTRNGGYHHIVIKDKLKPMPPVPSVQPGSYTSAVDVTLSAEDDCDIYYNVDGSGNYIHYIKGTNINIGATSTIKCYAKREAVGGVEGKESNVVSYRYEIIPNAPFLFDNNNVLLPNVYDYNSNFTVYVSDKNVFGDISDDSEVYYTFTDLPADNITLVSDPEVGWVKVNKLAKSIFIDRNRTVRLVTDKMGEYSEVSWYYLGVKPSSVTANYGSNTYTSKIDVELSTETQDAVIYYTIDGSDPIVNGVEYVAPITIVSNTTLRAVALYDGKYSDLTSYYYLFDNPEHNVVEAFYPSGVYEGSVSVSLFTNNADNTIEYRIDDDNTWVKYDGMLVIDTDTTITARSVSSSGVAGNTYTFVYKIKPLPPAFAPETTQFTNSDRITVYCEETTNGNTSRYDLYYTTDGTDPITSSTRIKADETSDSADVLITKYTVVSAVVLKDNESYSSVERHSYDIVTKKPVKPLMSLLPDKYIRSIENPKDYTTQFMPVPQGTEIYYTIGYDGLFVQDPVPNMPGTIKYDGNPIEILGQTTIKAIAVNVFGEKSDIGLFEYIVKPEAPISVPSATFGRTELPILPVYAANGSKVCYKINEFSNEFVFSDADNVFYIDPSTGNAYSDKNCTQLLGIENTEALSAPAKLKIKSVIDNVESDVNYYVYSLSTNPNVLAAPYADKITGVYEEINYDNNNNLLVVNLSSLNDGDTIQYRINNTGDWVDYDGNSIKIKEDIILQVRAKKGTAYSSVASYVYTFEPIPPIITLPSGRYVQTPVPTTSIKLSPRVPTDKQYTIWYRSNGDREDYRYVGQQREIRHTMSFKAYVRNDETQKVSENTIHYYIIESDSVATGSVYVANPYDVSRVSSHVLNTGEYANGIKLLTQNNNAQIHYFYSYTKTDGSGATTNNYLYDNAAPIMVNSSMDEIKITAWLEENDGTKIQNSDMSHTVKFVNLGVPTTTLGNDVSFRSGTKYSLVNDYPNDECVSLYYTLDGSDPTNPNNENRKKYSGEELTLTKAVTVKTTYYSACGKCLACKNGNYDACWEYIYGDIGVYRYAISGGGGGGGTGGGGGGGSSIKQVIVDNTRKYTKDIFDNQHPTHIEYINGYPDGNVRPEGKITREEFTSILYRITNHEYEKPFIVTGTRFNDVDLARWSVRDIEYMADKEVVSGYPDGGFYPANYLTRAEFAVLISRFTQLDKCDLENPFSDIEADHWAYGSIMSLYGKGILNGYDDGTVCPNNHITRAEVMRVINNILGRKPDEEYIKALDFNPYHDLLEDKWYYVDVLEATVTHTYILDDQGCEKSWDAWE